MIGKICPRGQDVAGLIRYLYGPGRREEHTDPHIIAGYRPPADLEPPLRANGSRDFRRLAGLLRLPHDALGTWGYAKPVWHCSMRAAPERPPAVGRGMGRHRPGCDAPHRAVPARAGRRRGAVDRDPARPGPHPPGGDAGPPGPDPAPDRERTLPGPRRLHGRRAAVRAAVHRPGRPHRGPLPRPAPRPAKPPATGAASRPGPRCAATSPPPPPPQPARRSSSPGWTRPGYWSGSGTAPRNPGQVTGYAVALPGDTARNGEPVWYGGGKLAADLCWPKLAQRWTRPARPDSPLTPGEADALWEYAARTAADATARIRYCTATGNPAAAADAASAASDTLHVAAAALGSRTLRRAADDYDRAARQPYGRVPAPTPAGNQLRHAARLISAYAYLTGDRTLTPIVLLVRLAALAEAVAELRESQQRAAQAAAALRAARHLRTATRPPATRPPGRPAARPPHHRHRNPHGPARPPPPDWPSSASPARPGPAGPHQASPDPARTTRRHDGHRHHGHADPPGKPRAAQQRPVGTAQASFCLPDPVPAHMRT